MKKNTFGEREFTDYNKYPTEEDKKLFEEEDQSLLKDDEQIYGGLGLWLRGQITKSEKEQQD